MAITMINPDELKDLSFFESHVWTKLKSMVFCAIMWHGKNSKKAELINVARVNFTKNDEVLR